MKKIIGIFLPLLFINVAFAQTRTTTYQNRTVKIFPYRIQFEETENYVWNAMLESMSVPYCPEKLEDGEYIIFFKPEMDLDDYEKSLKQFAKGDTHFIAVNFFIKNGLKDGPASFYDYQLKQKLIGNGFYSKDVKSGIWKFVGKDGKVTASYLNGKLQGKVVVEGKKNKLRMVRYYKEGQEDGKSEMYKGKKLISYYTFKAGKNYGPFFDSDNGEILSHHVLSGFSLSENFDSITQLYNKKGKLVWGRINSGSPLQGSDTTEMEWYVNASNFNLRASPFLNHHSENILYKKIYTNCYEINAKGQKFNNFNLIDKKIKIPFVYLNLDGDTILKVDRVLKQGNYITYQVKEMEYDKNHEVKSVEVSQSKFFYYGDEFINILKDSLTYKLSYNSKEIERFYLINRPVEGFNGFIIKKDSTITFDRKNQKPINGILEHYSIPKLNMEFSQWNQGETFISKWPDIEYKLIGFDTIEVNEENYIDESLSLIKTYKICTKDSSVIGTEGDQLINPYEVCWGWGWGNVYFVGKSNSVIYYKEKPYTGKVFINTKLSKKLDRYESQVDLKETKDGLNITRVMPQQRDYKRIVGNLKRNVNRYRSNNHGWQVGSLKEVPISFLFNYLNGKLDGYQRASSPEETFYELNFKNGISHGVQNYCLTKQHIEPLIYGEYLTRINYDSGRIDGYVILNNNENEPLLATKYNKGKLNGTYVVFNKNEGFLSEPKPLLEANFINDTLDGWVVCYHNGEEKERIHFIKGMATGYYSKNIIQKIEAEQSDSTHNYQPYTKIYKELKLKLENGIIKDTIYGYFDNGGIKYRAIVDKGFHHRYIYNWVPNFFIKDTEGAIDTSLKEQLTYSGFKFDETTFHNSGGILFGIGTYGSETGFDLDPLYDNVKATFTFYYKNGMKSQEGKMANNMKHGTWKFYGENGTLMKEIDYKSGRDSSTPNRIYYRGKIKAYYPNGKKMMEGLITDEELSYQCNQEVEVSYEEVYYLSFFNEAGDSLIKRQTGPVTDFHLNGNKHFSGQITNGLRTGLWKFYDPNGNLKAIGEYADGKKQGKWLDGDLGGVNYIDNACSINEALSMMKERQAKDIDITETLYEMGTEVSKSHLVLEKF